MTPTDATLRADPRAARQLNRTNSLDHNTSGMCAGYVQANLVIIPQEDAFDFLLFCIQNPGPCPILEVTAPGQFEPIVTALGADLRTDFARYEVYRHGELAERHNDIRGIVTDRDVCFLLGCSYSFEHLLSSAGLPIRHHEQHLDGALMYITNRECRPAGRFAGELVVTMRPVAADQVSMAVHLTAAHPEAHGAPVAIGSPEQLGLKDLTTPAWSSPVALEYGDTPVFWSCGVTATHVLQSARLDRAITHASGYMFLTDLKITP